MKQNFAKRITALLLVVILAAGTFVLCGCNNAQEDLAASDPTPVTPIAYKDKSFASLVSNVFSKPASEVTKEEIRGIRYFSISFYDGSYSVTIGFDDYINALASGDDNANSLLVRTTTSAPQDFEDMKYFTGITHFNLFNIYTFKSFSLLKECKNLENISIHTDTKNSALKSLDGLEALKSLKSFGLYGAIITDLAPLGALTELTSLYIGADYRMYEENDGNFYDIKALEPLNKLESLSISFSGVSDLSPVADAPIKYLNVYRSALSDISFLEAFTSLEEVSLTYNAIEDITPLTKLPNLKVINLDYNYINDVTPFAGIDAEKISYISMDMNSVEDWTPVKHLYKAGKLYTGYDLYFEEDFENQ